MDQLLLEVEKAIKTEQEDVTMEQEDTNKLEEDIKLENEDTKIEEEEIKKEEEEVLSFTFPDDSLVFHPPKISNEEVGSEARSYGHSSESYTRIHISQEGADSSYPVPPATQGPTTTGNMEWTREQVEQLIELYHGHTLLWDPTDSMYKNKIKRTNAWREIGEILQVDKDDAEKKMKNLISQFRRELKKTKYKSSNGVNEVYRSRWFAYNSLQFLADKHLSYTTYEAEFETTEDTTSTSGAAAECAGGLGEEEVTCENREGSRPSTSGRDSATPTRGLHVWQPSKRTHDDVAHIAYNVLKAMQRHGSEKDEHQLFADFIACKMRKLSTPYAQATVQNMIQNILYKAEVGTYDNPPTNCTQIVYSDTPSQSPVADCHDVKVLALDDPLDVHNINL